ncbi:MAG: hypothetical protein JEZ11_12040 [Desulfobacterales bacterium]|nr:hypothetical protein [Desulfobacterales bacterium]
MVHVIEEFKAFPNSVRNAIVFLVAGWLWHYVSLYRYFYSGNIPFKQIVIGVSVCFFVFRIRNWARVLCIVCNILIVVMYLTVTFSFLSAGKTHYATVAGFNVVLFSLATYFLAVGESSRFFKERSPAPGKDNVAKPEEDGV